MTGRPNNQRLAMLQGSRADFRDSVGVAEIDCHIAISHRRPDRIAKIALRDDGDLRVALCKISDGFSHAPSGADEQYANSRVLHLRKLSPHGEN
jgi:hypothetical protein